MFTFQTYPDLQHKKVNFHTHTKRCQHATGEEREYVEAAIQAGYDVLGFSDHAPYIFDQDYVSPIRMRMDELDSYVSTVLSLKQEYADRIPIHLGFEIEYFPKTFAATLDRLRRYPLEYLILGQHFFDDEIGWENVGRPYEDERHLDTYVTRIEQALETEDFLYVAHPDILNFTGDPLLYDKYMTRLILALKAKQIPLELNVNGFREGRNYPSPRFVQLGVEAGCDFFVGVDAHAPDHFLDTASYEGCKNLAESAGGHLLYTGR